MSVASTVRRGTPLFSAFSWAILWVGVLSLTIFQLHYQLAGEEIRTQFSADDGYYYMGIAQQWAQQGRLSADVYGTPTNGFHWLWQGMLAGLAVLVPFEYYTQAVGVLQYILVLAAVLGLVLACRSSALRLALGVVLCSREGLVQSVSAMEWALLVAISTFFALGLYRLRRGDYSLCLWAVLGVLARVDWVLVPLGVAVWYALGRRRHLREVGAAALCAIAAVGLVFGLNYTQTGQWASDSSQMKIFWGTIVSPDLWAVSYKLILCEVAFGGWVLALVCLGLGWQRGRRLALWAGLALVIVGGYAVLYYRYSDLIAGWYSSLGWVWRILFFAVVLQLCRRRPVLMGLMVAVLLANSLYWLYRTGFDFAFAGPFNNQYLGYKVAAQIVEKPLPVRLGAWNSGVIGYYTRGQVTNLDGLVNSDIGPYLRAGRAHEYLWSRGIGVVIDYPIMLKDPRWAQRVGVYGLPEGFFTEMSAFRGYPSVWNPLTVWRVAAPGELPLPLR